MSESERVWHEMKAGNGWSLPAKAPLWKRLPGIRHVRFTWNALMVSLWHSSGPGTLGIPSGYDEWVLYAIRRGWC